MQTINNHCLVHSVLDETFPSLTDWAFWSIILVSPFSCLCLRSFAPALQTICCISVDTLGNCSLSSFSITSIAHISQSTLPLRQCSKPAPFVLEVWSWIHGSNVPQSWCTLSICHFSSEWTFRLTGEERRVPPSLHRILLRYSLTQGLAMRRQLTTNKNKHQLQTTGQCDNSLSSPATPVTLNMNCSPVQFNQTVSQSSSVQTTLTASCQAPTRPAPRA